MRLTSQVRGERSPRTTMAGGMLLPPRPHALTALPGPVSVLLLTLLLMLCAIPVIATAQQRPQEIPQKQTWRVINDAPYRVVPAYSPLKKTGETLEELGFESVDALLSSIEKRSSSNSVAFSPDGRLLASGLRRPDGEAVGCAGPHPAGTPWRAMPTRSGPWPLARMAACWPRAQRTGR